MGRNQTGDPDAHEVGQLHVGRWCVKNFLELQFSKHLFKLRGLFQATKSRQPSAETSSSYQLLERLRSSTMTSAQRGTRSSHLSPLRRTRLATLTSGRACTWTWRWRTALQLVSWRRWSLQLKLPTSETRKISKTNMSGNCIVDCFSL